MRQHHPPSSMALIHFMSKPVRKILDSLYSVLTFVGQLSACKPGSAWVPKAPYLCYCSREFNRVHGSRPLKSLCKALSLSMTVGRHVHLRPYHTGVVSFVVTRNSDYSGLSRRYSI